MPDTHESLMDILGARINTVLEPLLPDNTTIMYPNQEMPTTPSDPWIKVSIQHGGNFQADIGAAQKRYRRMGRILFQCFGKLHVGTEALNQLVAHIETVFRGKKVDTINYITPEVIDRGRNGKYYELDVSCPFWVDVF